MKNYFPWMVVGVFLSNAGLAADTGAKAARDAVEKRHAEDRALCAGEPSSASRMQCLRDAKAEYDKAIKKLASAGAGEAGTCAGCGKVLSVKLVEKDGEGSAVGMVAGGVAGALLGNQIGKGGTRDVATIAGAAGGAYAGHKIEQKVNKVKKWEVAVHFDNGDQKTFSFDRDPGFSAGTKVKASGGGIVAR